jgi:hypothetical protein
LSGVAGLLSGIAPNVAVFAGNVAAGTALLDLSVLAVVAFKDAPNHSATAKTAKHETE